MSGKVTAGQPIKYTHKEKLRILAELEKYINEKRDYHSVVGFCVEQGIPKPRLYEWARGDKENAEDKTNPRLGERFKELIQKIHDRQEKFIEENTINGNIPTSFAIFKLKQPCIGWTDKQEVGMSGGMEISIGLPEFIKSEN